MEPIAPLLQRPEFPKSFNAVDAAADGNKFDELPESVVHHIFSFLKNRDVMNARAVSKSWRYLWNSMPHLDFNYEACRFCLSDNYEYKDFISRVLETHDESVSIKSCRLKCSNKEDDNSVYRWLHILAKKHVQKLYLSRVSDSENPFVLPWCLLASDSLEVLEIGWPYCVLKIPSCAGFSRLKSLTLVNIQLLDQSLFQNFISSCPLLEKLSLVVCRFHGFKVLDIAARNLRELVIDNYDCEGSEECDLKITCPNLVYFELMAPLVKRFSWGENPCFLLTAILHFFLDEMLDDEFTNSMLAINSMLEILKGVCHVESFKLCDNILKCISPAVAKPGCFSTIFYNLKDLTLSTCVEGCYMQSIIYLLKCAPNLQLLSVSIVLGKFKWGFGFDRYDYKCKMLDEDIECLTCHLKMVNLIYICDSDVELELIRFFLKNAHVLQKMSIIWGFGHNQKTKREKIMQKVMKFPRSSSHVNVTFH